MNLEYQQHGGDGANYSFDLPDTIIVDEEELEIEIYERFYCTAVNNEGSVS